MPRTRSLSFIETIVSGRPAVIERLADPRPPTSCGRLTDLQDRAGHIKAIGGPKIVDRSWAYEGGRRQRRHLLEGPRRTVPEPPPGDLDADQAPEPLGDMTTILHQVTGQAHAKARKVR